MKLAQYFDKENLHHAYLIEGVREQIIPDIINFCEEINIKTSGNPDFCRIVIDNFKIDEALDLRAMATNKSFTSGKKIFIICANTFSLDAENVMLKMFEEPIVDTHFFLIVPEVNTLLKTLVSRFYLIKMESNLELMEAEKFIKMPLPIRIDFIKRMTTKNEENETNAETITSDSTRANAVKFLNTLEIVLHKKFIAKTFDSNIFYHFFKVREFLRMPGSSIKNLMESVALIIPVL